MEIFPNFECAWNSSLLQYGSQDNHRQKGKKPITVHTTESENQHITAVLSCTALGQFCHPWLSSRVIPLEPYSHLGAQLLNSSRMLGWIQKECWNMDQEELYLQLIFFANSWFIQTPPCWWCQGCFQTVQYNTCGYSCWMHISTTSSWCEY